MKLRNSIMLIGRLGKDPEQRNTTSGKAVCNFSLATSEKYTNQQGQKIEDTQWHSCVAWGKLAEIICDLAKKGDEVAVRGKMTYRKWTDKNGNPRSSAEVVVDEFLTFQKHSSRQSEPEASAPSPESGSIADSLNDENLPF